jgi:glycine/D-amino acid oxidase-like deaminating enzyme
MKKKVAFVIGSGIAGVSIAEILSRNHYKVILLESKDKIGGEASLATQKWFHTGWLYAGLVDQAATMGCYKALHLYNKVYRETYGAERVNVNVSSEGVDYRNNQDGWFKDERIHYVIAMKSYEMNILSKLYWPIYFNAMYLRRMKRLKYRYRIVEPTDSMREVFNRWEGSSSGFKKYRIIRSTDAKIETEQVIKDLIGGLDDQAEIITEARFQLISDNNHTKLKIGNIVHTPDLIVIASGRSVPSHLMEIGAENYASQIKSVKSPILVVNEIPELPDFIRYTPIVPHTINHVKFNANGTRVSTVGSYYSFPVEKNVEIERYEEIMLNRLGLHEDTILGSYYGIKTEYTGNKERRYNHAIMRVNGNTFFALAGKFSQFPLLVHDFANQMGLTLSKQMDHDKISLDSDIFAVSLPRAIVNQQIETAK